MDKKQETESLEVRQQRALRIKKAATEAGFKHLGELAEACGLTRQQGYAWGNMANPRRPLADSYKAISRLTRKSVEWLDEGKEEPSPADELDYQKMKTILETIDQETSTKGIDLTPDKLTEIILQAYSEPSNARQRSTIQRMVRLLAM